MKEREREKEKGRKKKKKLNGDFYFWNNRISVDQE